MPATPRFYAENLSTADSEILLDRKETRHARSVLRIETGDAVGLFDGRGNEFSGVVVGVQDGHLRIAVTRNAGRIAGTPASRVNLGICVFKPERMEWLIEKSCELGVRGISPLLSDRCVVRMPRERWEAKLARWKKIAIASCKQCGRSDLPEIRPVETLKAFLEREPRPGKILIPTLAVRGMPLSQAVAGGGRSETMTVLIGPEGDFTPSEVELAVQRGAVPVDLGPLVLRSETAALVVLSVLGAMNGGTA